MKRLLLAIPLLLVSCSRSGVRYNVNYYFDYKTHNYKVFLNVDDLLADKNVHYVKVEDFYYIKVDEYQRKENKDILNEFYMTTKELFVYYIR